MDFPTAWTIAQSVPVPLHDSLCSYARTNGLVLCDCWVVGYADGNEAARRHYASETDLRRNAI